MGDKNDKSGSPSWRGIKLDIFEYHDYRKYLLDQINEAKKNLQGFTIGSLCKEINIAQSTISLVLTEKRHLTPKQIESVCSYLKLNYSQKSYFKCLHQLSSASSQAEMYDALKKAMKFSEYRTTNPDEAKMFVYLSNWYYVVIRELTALPDFQLNEKWIRKRIKYKVPLGDIKTAIKFLVDNDLIKIDENGNAKMPDMSLVCKTGVLKTSMSQFHRKMLGFAAESIRDTPSVERNISANIISIPKDKIQEITLLSDEYEQKILDLCRTDEAAEEVYYIGFAAFPLTSKDGNDK